MEDMGWERNMLFPWSNINRHQHQQELEETFIFGSENNIIMNPITTTTARRIMCSNQLTPATVDSINAASSFNSASQHWSHTVAPIPITTTAAAAAVVTSPESLDCLFSDSNAGDTSSDHDDSLSALFPDYKTLCNNNINNPGGDPVVEDGIVSQSSPEKKPNKNSGDNDVYDDNPPRSKKPRSDPGRPTSSTINFRQGADSGETDSEAIAQMKEMIYRAAAFRPVSFADETVAEKPKRKNVRISSDPQTVAARQRREKISERIRVLQKLVPGGSKMDTASMLDEAANYLKFLRSQVKALEQFGHKIEYVISSGGTTTDAHGTSQMIQNIDSNYNVTVGVPFPMQTHFLLPHQQQLYPTPPPA